MDQYPHNGEKMGVDLTFSGNADLEMRALMEQTGKSLNTLAIEGLCLRITQQGAFDEGQQLAVVQEYTDGSFEVVEIIDEFDDQEPVAQETATTPTNALPFKLQ